MGRTAVAAPDAFEDLFEFIDGMTLVDLLKFNLKVSWYLLSKMLPADEADL